MRTLRYIVLALLFLLVVVIVIGFFLPSKVRLERSIEIKRQPSVIFNVINDLNNFNKWSPWYDLDINARYIVSGPKAGVGSKISWQGNEKVGSGSNEIIESVENAHIKTKFFFGKNDQPALSTITLTANDKTTTASWAFESDFGYNVFYRYFGLVLEDMIAPDYEKGLKKLKKHVESLPLYDYSNISITALDSESVYVYSAQIDVTTQNISLEITKGYEKIIAFLKKKNIAKNGTPKIINLSFENNVFEFLVAIPVNDNSVLDETGSIQSKQMYNGKTIKLIHKGSNKNFNQQYEVLNAYMIQNQLQPNGDPWEDYVTDPADVDENNLITHIYQPIK